MYVFGHISEDSFLFKKYSWKIIPGKKFPEKKFLENL